MNVNPLVKVGAAAVLGGGAIGAGLAATRESAEERADVVKGARTVAITGGVISALGLGFMALSLRVGAGTRNGSDAVVAGIGLLGNLLLGSAAAAGGAAIGVGGLSALSGAALVNRGRGD